MTFPNCNIKTSEIIKQIFKRENKVKKHKQLT